MSATPQSPEISAAMVVAVISSSIALLSLVLNYANYRYTRSKTKSEAQRQRLLEAISAFVAQTREMADETQRHLAYEPEHKRKGEIGRLEKKCQLMLESLKTLAPSANADLTGAYFQWYLELLGDGYPVLRKANSFQPEHERYRRVHIAQQKMEGFLSPLAKRVTDTDEFID